VLGARAAHRFLLSDAQHVVAREAGYRTWGELVRASDVDEWTVEPGLAYGPGDPVVVRVRRRGRYSTIDDDGAAVAKAGRPRGWLEVARRIVEKEHWLNVNRRGVIFVGAFEHRGAEWRATLVQRVADASLAVYQEVLELDRD
jgi:hypothetical protein